MDQKTGLGERLKEERERLGFSQPAFAALAEASKSSQASWEKETAYPNAKALEIWARVGVDVGYLVTGKPSSGVESLTQDERDLLKLFRAAPLAVKAAAIGALQGGSTDPKAQVMKNTGSGSVQIGHIGGDYNPEPKSARKKAK
ncbi:helix-turn-helix domain-containing protein [Comamonas suwonensis]|uniref:Helix-turn-helix transcriptional regulator n=1 Tax=Comamonas suwonensis TaxID=2606214 RepID=A0A843B7Y9_9BURK|nr:helix-turn-helix transcriptional regulator [Comamonas suwonensis]MBI1626941.1 helix-turn-helix transcriptional regulator [Comamonas suwonensis]